MIGQLLASEGFNSVEELAMVDAKEIAGIEGFDEDTASELQTRAREYLDKIEGELDAKRKELGVADELKEVPGVTTAMLVQLRRERHQDRRGSGRLRHRRSGRLDRAQGRRGESRKPGILDGFDMSREEAEALIMQARLKAGWVTEADLAPPSRRPKKPPRRRGATPEGTGSRPR